MKTNFETLEVGRTYKSVGGKKIEIVDMDTNDYPFKGSNGLFYSHTGLWYRAIPTDHDLEELLPEDHTARLAELEAKRDELDKEIEELKGLKNSVQTLYCEAFLYDGGDEILIDINQYEEQRELKIKESSKDGRHPTIATFDLPFRKVDGKWEAAFEIAPK